MKLDLHCNFPNFRHQCSKHKENLQKYYYSVLVVFHLTPAFALFLLLLLTCSLPSHPQTHNCSDALIPSSAAAPSPPSCFCSSYSCIQISIQMSTYLDRWERDSVEFTGVGCLVYSLTPHCTVLHISSHLFKYKQPREMFNINFGIGKKIQYVLLGFRYITYIESVGHLINIPSLGRVVLQTAPFFLDELLNIKSSSIKFF